MKDIRELALPPLPPPQIQHLIADILSAYDDLIENNTRRIAILEAMAQAIYREWFVEFRFPGHEKVKFVETPLGKIPAGWSKHLGDVVTLKRGYDLPQRDRRAGTVPLVSSSGITDSHDKSMAKGPGVVTGRYGTLGEVFYIQQDFWPLNTTLYVRDFHENEPLLVVHLLRSLNLASQNAAGAVPGVNRNALHLLDVVFPPPDLQKRIAPTIETIESSCRNLRSRNANLRTTRDLLLPKLISGHLDVEDLDIETGETVTMTE
jgi:type I restriction enzyme S subunit